jgi:hypothetical protein
MDPMAINLILLIHQIFQNYEQNFGNFYLEQLAIEQKRKISKQIELLSKRKKEELHFNITCCWNNSAFAILLLILRNNEALRFLSLEFLCFFGRGFIFLAILLTPGSRFLPPT